MAVVNLTQSALQALRRGQNYFRIRENWTEADTYNIDVSIAAIAVGPDSDIDSIGITYPDFGAGSAGTRTAQIGVGAPWTAGMDARMDLTNGAGIVHRITVGTGSYGRHYAVGLTPLLDLIFYFKSPNFIPSIRPPKWQQSKLFTSASVGIAEQTVFTQVYMGRHKASITLYNPDAVKTLTAWRFVGLLYDGTGVDIEHNVSPATGSTNTLAALASASYVLTDARFDAIRLYVTPSATETPLRYTWEISDS